MAEEHFIELHNTKNTEGAQATESANTPEIDLDPPSIDANIPTLNEYRKDDLSSQETTLNLNNHKVRLTLWSMIYIVHATTLFNNAVRWLAFYSDKIEENSNDENWSNLRLYYVWTIISTALQITASGKLLCIILCKCCNCCDQNLQKLIVMLLFVIAACFQLPALINGMLCIFDGTSLSAYSCFWPQ